MDQDQRSCRELCALSNRFLACAQRLDHSCPLGCLGLDLHPRRRTANRLQDSQPTCTCITRLDHDAGRLVH